MRTRSSISLLLLYYSLDRNLCEVLVTLTTLRGTFKSLFSVSQILLLLCCIILKHVHTQVQHVMCLLHIVTLNFLRFCYRWKKPLIPSWTPCLFKFFIDSLQTAMMFSAVLNRWSRTIFFICRNRKKFQGDKSGE